ncbi:glycine zipper domain-containing protein [Nocardia wallacei]|uniref:glycine zipper domain-containing protein n=1 Tax=Nocardia wallacei TaxID=480035 RepID=UPI002454D2EB|nr:glycine zipper domain-containing protein [Nocardia wallacei]
MLRYTLVKASCVVSVVAAPLVAAAVFAGGAAADTGRTAGPIAGIPLQSEDVATNPDAMIPDPVLNGASAGGSIGSAVGSAVGLATGSVTGSAGSLIGTVIGALVGATNPGVVPQVLP